MYIKIIKCSETAWYKTNIRAIYEVEDANKSFKIKGTGNYLKKQDCEIIDFNPDQQISEEMADKLLNNIYFDDHLVNINIYKKPTKENWKQKGYIKQNREDEIKNWIREKLDQDEIHIFCTDYDREIIQDLIKNYENKIEELKDEIK